MEVESEQSEPVSGTFVFSVGFNGGCKAIRSVTTCNNWKQRPDKFRMVIRCISLFTRSTKNPLGGLSKDVPSPSLCEVPKSRLNAFLKIDVSQQTSCRLSVGIAG